MISDEAVAKFIMEEGRIVKRFNTIDTDEAAAAATVIMNRPLSGYVGTDQNGGWQCMSLESEWASCFGVKHAVAVNSGTSGLLAACMAIGIGHDDEVIVSAYTMSATAAVPKLLGANIRFADIEPYTFCIDPHDVPRLVGPKTKAVIATNLFGHPARVTELRTFCDAQGIYLIEDNAQSIFAKEYDQYTGTIGHIGIFSLNVHKQLQVGEGGICVTNDDRLDTKLREAMNHGELRNGILGLNLRMTEVTAAMARKQLAKGAGIIEERAILATIIDTVMEYHKIPVLLPQIRSGCEHSRYCWAGLIHGKVNISPPFRKGYMRPLYELPAFKQHIKLPQVEMAESKIMLLELCSIDPTGEEVETMVKGLKA